MQPLCYVCEQEVIKPIGYTQSKVLVIGEYPGPLEIEAGKPFVSLHNKQSAGKVLRKELALVGADLYQFRVTNMWWHKPNKDDEKHYEQCLKASLESCLEEAKGKQAILLIGSECVEHFTGYKVSDVSGLQVESNQLSASIIFACIQPATVFHSRGIGEVRLAITRFVSTLKEEGII